jgi:hypothetical protein
MIVAKITPVSKINSKITSKQAIEQLLKVKPTASTILKTVSKIKSIAKQKEVIKQIIKTTTLPKLKTSLKNKLKTLNKQKIILLKIKIPVLKKVRSNVKGYIIKVRRQKKFINVPRIVLNKTQANNLGAWIVDNTTAATYKIVKSKNNINRSVKKIIKTPTKFRSSKSKTLKGSKIELKKYRINTRGEAEGLAASKLIKKLK